MLCEDCLDYPTIEMEIVLILVLMEYALRGYSTRTKEVFMLCLNPCFNGICSARSLTIYKMRTFIVLILVLMEYALRVDMEDYKTQWINVLILVLMEYALRV